LNRAPGYFAFAGLLAALGGCAVGPDYQGPPSVTPRAETATTFVRGDHAGGDDPAVVSARWWETFRDPMLDDITLQALAHNPTIGAAIARLRQARSEVRLQFANLLPTGSGDVLYAQTRLPPLGSLLGTPGSSGGTDFNLYADSFDASWEIDVFGGQRRALEAAHDTREGTEASLEDAQVSLSAEVSNAYINLRDRQQRIMLGNRAVDLLEKTLALAKQRYDGGTASKLDISRIENQLETTRASLAPLKAERDVYLDELATLTGQEPGALDATLRAPRRIPLPPARVKVGDPASLLRRRPDIRAAERTIAADTAKIGQAEAKRFPEVRLLGIIGLGGTRASDLTNLDDYTALLAPQISWSFLDFGRNQARVHEAESVRDEAEAQYHDRVLGALRDAEDSLSRFKYGRERVATLARARKSADEAASLASERYEAGAATLTDLLDTQRQKINAEQDLSQAVAQLSSYYVGINKALGLGWEAPKS
jgi:NodT family efflux transporter outer membrane factor (OMF) lipoprotein